VKVHHLNCGTVQLPGANLVCHVLLVETERGLVLVDTGFGLDDIAAPAQRLGVQRHFVRPVLREEEAAARQVERLGFRRSDVRHIVLTHLDADHIGGLSDFPEAKVHVTAQEVEGAIRAPRALDRLRFRPPQWAHGPHFVEHAPEGETWFGFKAARELREISPGIVLIAMAGHTRGHAAVAVDAGSHWILHAGDTFYAQGTLDGKTEVPWPLRALERFIAYDIAAVRDNQARLAELVARGDPKLRVICAHDRTLYEASLT
jgi:glyoxylase-like metal-dependent hydrolase (beta-lactamase superfamily II)